MPKYVGSLDAVFAADGVSVVNTPIRAPRANAYAERWVRSVRAECLDWILIWNRRHLERVLSAYVAHYNLARPHRGIGLEVPVAPNKLPPPTGPIERVDVLGGSIHARPSGARALRARRLDPPTLATELAL